MDYSLVMSPPTMDGNWKELTFSTPDEDLFQKVADMLLLFVDCVERKPLRQYTVSINPEFKKQFKTVTWGEE